MVVGMDDNQKPGLAAAQAANIRRQAELDSIEPVMEIPDVETAKSPEVLQFCEKELAGGTTWSVLRRKLGLGPANVDKRWRVIRDNILHQEIPESPEEYLKSVNATQEEILIHLQEQLDEIAVALKAMGSSEEEIKTKHHYFKMKTEIMEKMLKANSSRYERLLKAKKLRQNRQGRYQGINIHIHTKVPRPTEVELAKAREVSEMTTGNIKIIEASKKASNDD
jgi:hypothetical protein